jgi:hypothetical protein
MPGGSGLRVGPGGHPAGMDTLSDTERAILVFEQLWGPASSGGKEAAIQEAFLLSGARYQEQLSCLAGRVSARAAFPALVRRLQGLDAGRRRAA